MSSTNEELPPPPKPRVSPLEFRNTDLVSRLLAATPPYLYNMPLVPNSYFFSEMLRSFVQAKAENSSRAQTTLHHRRSRKRSWAQTRSEYFHKDSSLLEKPQVPSPNWNIKPHGEKCFEKKSDRPLELTIDKPILSNTKINDIDIKGEPNNPVLNQRLESSESYGLEKQDIPTSSPNNHVPVMYPNLPQNFSQDSSSSSNMILPPPPPIWYPPLYPTPYGIDPLHFFIDLRVSGHIYDRKNSKESSTISGANTSPTNQPCTVSSSQAHASEDSLSNNEKISITPEIKDIFKQSRHSSAFSVPIPSNSKNLPMNLSSDRYVNQQNENPRENKLKFDVKSMGFDKSSSRTSINYIMSNIGNIYNRLHEESYKVESEEHKMEDEINTKENVKTDVETEAEKEKRVKDLRALIGLELVVDYMNHAKPEPQQHPTTSEESSTDLESAGSPAVEVVAINEDLAHDL